MEKLKIGDKVVYIKICIGSKIIYKFAEVESLTNTRAILDNGDILINEPLENYDGKNIIAKFKQYGNPNCNWQLSKTEIIQAYETQLHKNEIDYWFRNRKFTDSEKEIIYEKFKELGILKKE